MIDYAEYECGCHLYSPGGIPDLCPTHGRDKAPAPSPREVRWQDPDENMTRGEYFATLTQEQKLELCCSIIDLLTTDQKAQVLFTLAQEQPQTDTQLEVNSNDQFVRISFGKPLAWFVMPKAHARQLGQLLLQHGGATVHQVPNPTQSHIPKDGSNR